MHTITLSNASIDDFRYVRKKGKTYQRVLNSAARTIWIILNFFILKFLDHGFLIIDSKLLILDYSKFRSSKFLYFKFEGAIPNSNLS